MKVLVVFDMIPEEQFRAIVEMDDSEYQFFSKAHNVYLNTIEAEDHEEGSEAANVISKAFSSNPEYIEFCTTEKEREYYGKWKNDKCIQDISGVSKVIFSGFIC